jgi:hypothetical protein
LLQVKSVKENAIMLRLKNKPIKKTKAKAFQDIVKDYIADGQPWPADAKTLAAWAISRKRWDPPRKSMIALCAKELATAMRQEMETDPQGRLARAKNCATVVEKDAQGRTVQKTFWFDKDTETPDLMRLSLQQRRNGILGCVKQLKTDRDSYNDNNSHGAYIQMSFDFESDLEELAQDTEYKPTFPKDDQNEESF